MDSASIRKAAMLQKTALIELQDTELHKLLDRPNPAQSYSSWLTEIIAFGKLTGNRYIYGIGPETGDNLGKFSELYVMPSQNMEIISIPLKGALSHKDNMGNKRAIEVGEVQVMSAGTGLTHSEFNDSKTDAVNFLQLWIIPEEINVEPNYEQRGFASEGKKNQLQAVVAPKISAISSII